MRARFERFEYLFEQARSILQAAGAPNLRNSLVGACREAEDNGSVGTFMRVYASMAKYLAPCRHIRAFSFFLFSTNSFDVAVLF
jgi:hypothetical protein